MHPSELFEQRPNVKELGLETETTPELRFDVRRDVSEAQWTAALAELQTRAEKGFARRGDWGRYGGMAINIHMLDARRAPQLTEEQRLQIRAELSADADADAGVSFLSVADFYHEYFLSHNIDYTDKEWKTMSMKLASYRFGSFDNFAALARALRYSDDPRRPEITERDWERMNAKLSHLRTDPEKWSIIQYANLAMCMTELDPTRAPSLNEEDWEKMWESLTSYRSEGDIDAYMSLAASMKRLSPRMEVTATDGSVPPLPETKNF